MKFVYTCEFTGGQIWGHLTLREDNHYLSPKMGRGEGGEVRRDFGGITWFLGGTQRRPVVAKRVLRLYKNNC